MANLKIEKMSYPQLVKLYNSNAIGWEDLRSEYTKLRKRATAQLRAIKRSDVPFIDEDSQPIFKPVSELKTLSDVLHETADINKFIHSPYYSIKKRRETRDTVIEKLRARGWEVNEQNWTIYLAFIRWYQAHADVLLYDSDDARMIAFFNQNYNRANMNQVSRWQRVYRDAKRSGFFDNMGAVPNAL